YFRGARPDGGGVHAAHDGTPGPASPGAGRGADGGHCVHRGFGELDHLGAKRGADANGRLYQWEISGLKPVSSKFQAPSSRESSNSKHQKQSPHFTLLEVGIWDFFGRNGGAHARTSTEGKNCLNS